MDPRTPRLVRRADELRRSAGFGQPKVRRAEAADGEILLSPRAYAAVEGAFDIVPRGEVVLKGIHEPVAVVSVVGPMGGQAQMS